MKEYRISKTIKPTTDNRQQLPDNRYDKTKKDHKDIKNLKKGILVNKGLRKRRKKELEIIFV